MGRECWLAKPFGSIIEDAGIRQSKTKNLDLETAGVWGGAVNVRGVLGQNGEERSKLWWKPNKSGHFWRRHLEWDCISGWLFKPIIGSRAWEQNTQPVGGAACKRFWEETRAGEYLPSEGCFSLVILSRIWSRKLSPRPTVCWQITKGFHFSDTQFWHIVLSAGWCNTERHRCCHRPIAQCGSWPCSSFVVYRHM